MKHFANNSAILIRAPEPGDDRPRNAFGVLLGFGAAYAEYYRRKDAEQKASKEQSRQHPETIP